MEPGAQHNLGVGIVEPVRLQFEGSVGYYCAGMSDGPTVAIRGSAGWGVAEGMPCSSGVLSVWVAPPPGVPLSVLPVERNSPVGVTLPDSVP